MGGRTSTTRFGNGSGAGLGWGGPARGAGQKRARAPTFEAGNQAAAGSHDMSRSKRAEAALDALFDLAVSSTDAQTRIAAACAWLDRVEGKPVQKVMLDSDVDALTDEQLERRLVVLLAENGLGSVVAASDAG